jgi:hypothetical protein
LKTLDSAFSYGFDDVSAPRIWGANSDILVRTLKFERRASAAATLRWGYIVAIDTSEPFPVTIHDIDPSTTEAAQFLAFDFWAASRESWRADPASGLVVVDHMHPLHLPACPAPELKVLNSTYWAFAPVLANGWVYLGEMDKIVTASAHRVRSITVLNQSSVKVELLGAAGELITSTFVSLSKGLGGGDIGKGKATLVTAICKAPEICAGRHDKHGTSKAHGTGECTVYATCTRGEECTCSPT